ncbi:MAG: RHS repeat-associated core domain-containing protein, partial [Prevotella sp.]|nr:RHS repeat-associated core domain-containing protein [Prevotella sp.]
ITYDAIGNPLTDGTWTYTWQQGKQLALMQKTENGVTTTVSFEYNEDGLRTKKTVTVGQAETVTEYVLHGKNVVHLTRGTDELHFYYDAQGKPAVVVCNSVAYGYLYNLQGDVLALVDGTGSKVVEYRYDAWGKPISKTGTLASTLGTLQPFRYRGYVWDEETEDYYLRSRYYRPEWCRFVNADSVIEENTYTYCSNNAINAFDPDGYSEAYADLLRIGGAALLIVITVGTMMRPALVNTSISIGNITTKPNSLIIDAVTSATTVDAKDSSLNNYSVYWFQSEHMDLPYVGITMRPKTREREHQRRKNDPNIHLSIIATGLSKDKARVAETAIIAAYTKKGLENRIYSIAPWRFRKGRFRSEINDVWYSLQEAFRDLWEIENDR